MTSMAGEIDNEVPLEQLPVLFDLQVVLECILIRVRPDLVTYELLDLLIGVFGKELFVQHYALRSPRYLEMRREYCFIQS